MSRYLLTEKRGVVNNIGYSFVCHRVEGALENKATHFVFELNS